MTNMVSAPIDPVAEGWRLHDSKGFLGLVGPVWEKPHGDGLVFGFRAEEKHENLRGVVQGGMLMTFADRTLGALGRHHNNQRPQATIQLDVHFIDAVQIGDFVLGWPRLVRRTRSVMFLEGIFTVDDRTVLTAKGVWKILDVV